MRRLQRYGGAQIRQRRLTVLSRQAKHQVEVEVVETGVLRGAHGGQRLPVVVNASDGLEQAGLETLDTEREAVDAGFAEAPEAFLVDGAGVGLQGDLGAGSERYARSHRAEQPINRCR